MKELYYTAYIAALLLWIPLGILVAVKPSTRRRVMVPLVVSVIGAAYEVFAKVAYGPNVIRIDILLAMDLLGAVDAIFGISLLIGARGRPDRGALIFAGVLCLAVPVMAMMGNYAFEVEKKESDRNYILGQQLLYEASFRDDEAQKHAFGELKPGKNPWSGYYAGDADRYPYLVINDEGRFWLPASMPILNIYMYRGQGTPATDAFEGTGDPMKNPLRVKLRRGEGDSYLLEINSNPASPQPALETVPMRKRDPPRFPRPAASPRDEVRFLGVFSGIYDEKNASFWLTQVWLWESGGEVWGRYLRDFYRRGGTKDFISTGTIATTCAQECKVLSFETGRGRVTLTRVSDDAFTVTEGSADKGATLKRGETLPGFLYDLAPLATKKENQEWLTAVVRAESMISWRVPSAPDSAPTSVPSSQDPSPPR